VVRVFEIVNAERDEAAAEDAAEERDAAADGPVAQADLLGRRRAHLNIALLAERHLRQGAKLSVEDEYLLLLHWLLLDHHLRTHRGRRVDRLRRRVVCR